jgi:recombination protein U
MGYWNSRGLRGSFLEDLLNVTNELYKQRGLAIVQKIPTPITPTQVDNKERVILKGYFERKSTVDYIGLFKGTAFCFDAKQTGKDYLPLQNIHNHQMDFMERYEKHLGVSFLLVHFALRDQVFFLPHKDLRYHWDQSQNGGRKSIHYDDFEKKYLVENKNGFPLHYLEALNVCLNEQK